MNSFMKIFMNSFDVICLTFLSALVSLWWTPELTQGKQDVAFARATGLLIIFLLYFYKSVLKKSPRIGKIFSTFYLVLAVFTLAGYSYGFFAK